MAIYKTTLVKKEEVAEGTMAFYFEKPREFNFIAGQYASLSLINPIETDDEGNSRFFSMASSPKDNYLMFATRMRGTAFKRVLKSMPIGAEIKIDGPHGYFTLGKDASKPAVFLIGGIGITPVLSIIKNAAEEKLPQKLFLFYSNRRPEDAAFLPELQNLEKENVNFKFIPTMTEIIKSKREWPGETGFIAEEMIKKYVQGINSPVYYMSGPPMMIKAMRDVLEKIGISESVIKFEEFAGY